MIVLQKNTVGNVDLSYACGRSSGKIGFPDHTCVPVINVELNRIKNYGLYNDFYEKDVPLTVFVQQ